MESLAQTARRVLERHIEILERQLDDIEDNIAEGTKIDAEGYKIALAQILLLRGWVETMKAGK